MDAPGKNKVKICKSYNFDPDAPLGACDARFEQPFNEFTVQVW